MIKKLVRKNIKFVCLNFLCVLVSEVLPKAQEKQNQNLQALNGADTEVKH